ncbi:hypothetical protein [Flavobacterium sp. 3HN19-14]|uniref:hypothetical protein n=1 Tax=Flavobacterium sp. 3HN19-14 TaxID=3448133 RepID=UPI003EE0A1BA
MKFHPILFSTAMVQAILAGTKTQTRRIVKGIDIREEGELISFDYKKGSGRVPLAGLGDEFFGIGEQCPFGVEGDVLWVRETIKVGAWNDEESKVAFDYRASPEIKKTPWVFYEDDEKFFTLQEKLLQKLDKLGIEPRVEEDEERFYFKWKAGESPFKWTPGIHMPKEACRIFLKVKSVNVQRLQSISTDDIKSEGVNFPGHYVLGVENNALSFLPEGKNLSDNPATHEENLFAQWAELWCKINGRESWDANPWVWIIEFERIEKPENFLSNEK